MGSIFTTLLNSSNALGVYSQALSVVSNDVVNANTPGYVKQTPILAAQPFDITVALPGGVAMSGIASSRSVYAEQYVRNQQGLYGYAQQKSSDLSQLSGLFDVTGKTGIGPALDSLFSSFSQLSITPNDPAARNTVLTKASQVVQQFHIATAGLQSTSSQVTAESQSYVDKINHLASTIAQINGQSLYDYKGNVDAGLDAQMNSSLEELSKYVNYSSLQQPDGSVTIYIGGRTPLVVGDEVQALQGDFSSPQARILDSKGDDVTSQITQGQLAASLEVQNSRIPSYQGSLDALAQNLADQVNTVLSNGVDQYGATPNTNLFTYNAIAPAGSLGLDSTLTIDQIAAASQGAAGGNGNAIALAALGTAKTINGYTFTGAFGSLAGQVGSDISDAQSSEDAHTQVLSQAQNLRQQQSGVSFDEEAARLMEFQKAYQATSKLISVLNTLTDSALSLIPGG